MFVYLITNTVNGKKYVGQHSGEDLQKYWKWKISCANSGYKGCLFNAIRKYGFENFTIKPIAIVGTKWELDLYEIGLIRSLNTKVPNGYNLTDGGEGAVGAVRSKETRNRMSEAAQGHVVDDLTRRKISESRLGKRHSSETLVLMSSVQTGERNNHFGHRHTEASIARMSSAKIGNKNALGHKHSEESRRKMSESAKLRCLRNKQRRGVMSCQILKIGYPH